MFIGIDIGGTTILSGLVDDNGNIVSRREKPTGVDRGYNAIEADIIALIKELIIDAEKLDQKVSSVGIGIPGIADVEGDNVIYCTNLKWWNVPLGRNLKKELNIPVFIENDATVAGLAESVKGVTNGYENSLFITIGTGIGSGIIIGNKIYSGAHGVGAEVGHIIVGENFYNCNCGNNGCLETFASATAMIKYTRKILEEGFTDTIIFDKIRGDLSLIDAKIVFDSAKEGDELANQVVDRMVKYLSIGIVNLINVIDPDIIAIGGGVSRAGSVFLDRVKNQVQKHILYKEVSFGDIVLAKLSNDAGIIGAAMLERYK